MNDSHDAVPSQEARGERRREPAWWDHQRPILVALRRCIEDVLNGYVGKSGRGRVFDLGCGDRPYEPLIRARGFDYVGCDLEGKADIFINPGEPIATGDASATGVVSFQVLEHVWDIDWYLGECRRLLVPGGWLLLSTHGVWPYHPHPTDFRRWTVDGLQAELEARGLKVIAIKGLLGPLGWTTQIRALGLREVLRKLPLLRRLVPVMSMAMNIRIAIEEWLTPEWVRQQNASVYVAFCRRSDEPVG